MSKLALTLCLLTAVLVLPGCHSPSNKSGSFPYLGTYVLETIKGKALPVSPTHQGGAPLVKAGQITLKADGSFTSSMNYALPSGGVTSRDFSGTFTVDGEAFRLKWDGAGTTTATLNGKLFTMTNEGLRFAYRR